MNQCSGAEEALYSGFYIARAHRLNRGNSHGFCDGVLVHNDKIEFFSENGNFFLASFRKWKQFPAWLRRKRPNNKEKAE